MPSPLEDQGSCPNDFICVKSTISRAVSGTTCSITILTLSFPRHTRAYATASGRWLLLHRTVDRSRATASISGTHDANRSAVKRPDGPVRLIAKSGLPPAPRIATARQRTPGDDPIVDAVPRRASAISARNASGSKGDGGKERFPHARCRPSSSSGPEASNALPTRHVAPREFPTRRTRRSPGCRPFRCGARRGCRGRRGGAVSRESNESRSIVGLTSSMKSRQTGMRAPSEIAQAGAIRRVRNSLDPAAAMERRQQAMGRGAIDTGPYSDLAHRERRWSATAIRRSPMRDPPTARSQRRQTHEHGHADRSYHGQICSARSPRDHRIAARRVNQGGIVLAERAIRMAQTFGESGIRSPECRRS